MEKVGIKEEDADKLTKHEIDGSLLTGLTVEDLMSDGLSFGASYDLVPAAALLWKNITIFIKCYKICQIYAYLIGIWQLPYFLI